MTFRPRVPPVAWRAAVKAVPRCRAVPVTQSARPVLWQGRGSDRVPGPSPSHAPGHPKPLVPSPSNGQCHPPALRCPRPATKVTLRARVIPVPLPRASHPMPRPHPRAREEGGRPVGPLQLALGDVPLTQEPHLGLGHCGRVASSRCDLTHGDTSARVTPRDVPRGSPGAAEAEARRGGEVSRGVSLGGLRTTLFFK